MEKKLLSLGQKLRNLTRQELISLDLIYHILKSGVKLSSGYHRLTIYRINAFCALIPNDTFQDVTCALLSEYLDSDGHHHGNHKDIQDCNNPNQDVFHPFKVVDFYLKPFKVS